MIYEIRLKGRQKQGECSAILTITFFVLLLLMLTVNFIPMVYVTAIKPLLLSGSNDKFISLFVSLVLLFMVAMLYSCLSFGTDRFMLKRAENTIAGAGDIFYYFAPKRAVSLGVFLLKFSFCKMILLSVLMIPFFLCSGVFVALCNRGFSALVCGVFIFFTLVFLLSGLVAYWEISDTYFLVRYTYIKGEFINFSQLLSQSQNDMNDKIRKFRRLKRSFTGWFLLCIFLFPLPYVWSYYRQTKACFAVEC